MPPWPFIEAFTITFWFIVAVWILVEVLLSGDDNTQGWRFTTLALFLGAVWLFTTFNPFAWAWENLRALLIYAVLYVAMGALWSIFKWWMFVGDKARAYREKRAGWRGDYETYLQVNPPPIPLPFEKWVQMYRSRPLPSAADERHRIQFWIAWWPFSVLNTAVGDLLFRFFRAVYEWLSGIYNAITKRRFAEFDGDFK